MSIGATLERGALLHKRYRIVEILGQGGMGSVYRAIDENLGVDVAVKENLFTTDEYARQFRLEAVLLANLRHPNLPRVTDHFVVGEQGQYLVMDFIEGEDLRQRMERTGTVSEQEAILVGAAMCDALQFLHTRKPAIIHRDVKPGNVRIAPDGHVYLVDFGLAKLVKGGQATTTGARAMTPGYSPPEQYGTARTDPRTDIYSLGATLYAALCGVIPEDGLARAMDNVVLTPLRERNPRVSRRLAAAIEKAMAVRPEDRFQSAEELKSALLSSSAKTQKLEGEIVVGPPPGVAAQAGRLPELAQEKPITARHTGVPPLGPARKKGWGTGCWVSFSFFLLTLLLILLAVIFFWSPLSSYLPAVFAPATPTVASVTPRATDTATPLPAQPSATPTATDRPTPSATSQPLGSPTAADTPVPAFSPTPAPTGLGGGSGQLAFASNRGGQPQIYVMNSDGSDQVQLTILPGGACQPAWSPDGERIVFVSPCPDRQDQYPDSQLFLMQADGTGISPLSNGHLGDFDPAWSPDGIHVAYTSMQDGLAQVAVLDLDSLTVSLLTHSSSDNRFPQESSQPAWSPDGSQIVYTAKRLGVYQVWSMNATGGEQVQLIRSGSTLWDFLPSWSPDGKSILFSETSGPQIVGWLMTYHPGGTSESAASFRNGNYAADAEYSPDGHWVAFEGTQDGITYNIYRITGDGRNRTALTTDKKRDFDPAWRPAGAR